VTAVAERTATALLAEWVGRQADAAGRAWFDETMARLHAEASEAVLLRHIGFASRRLGRAALALDDDDRSAAEVARPGWRPQVWTIDGAARVAMLLVRGTDGDAFAGTLDRLCRMAEVHELVAYYRGLPLFPDPARHQARAAEGIRTNMTVVFEAVAHQNPYPAEQLEQGAWNQMVLKALFIGSALHPIVGLDRRANPALARMLCDYAHERWAAGRVVSPELWRCVGPHADDAAISDLRRAISQGATTQRRAAALALRHSPHPGATAILDAHDELREAASAGTIRWDSL
jgi:hypothetical protein